MAARALLGRQRIVSGDGVDDHLMLHFQRRPVRAGLAEYPLDPGV